MPKELHIKVLNSSAGGPVGSDPKTNPWVVMYHKGKDAGTFPDDWVGLGRWPTKPEAIKQATRFAKQGQARGFQVTIGKHQL